MKVHAFIISKGNFLEAFIDSDIVEFHSIYPITPRTPIPMELIGEGIIVEKLPITDILVLQTPGTKE